MLISFELIKGLTREAMGERKEGVIALFDIDGTLTYPRKVPHLHNVFFWFRIICVKFRSSSVIQIMEVF